MVILEKRVNGIAAADLNRFVRRAQALAQVPGEVSVLIAGNSRVQELNRRFRRRDHPTDVLSFPRPQGGDIAISAEIARENARRFGHRSADELKILILHGMLHLAGYDHERDNGRMAAREARLRAQLGLPDSLISRSQSHAAKKERPAASRRSATSPARKSRTRKVRARARRSRS